MYDNLIKKGKTDEEAKAIIVNIEPFNFHLTIFEIYHRYTMIHHSNQNY